MFQPFRVLSVRAFPLAFSFALLTWLAACGGQARAAGLVIWMVMREVLLLLAIGLAVGIPSAMALGGYVGSQLYGIQPHDPMIAGWTVVLLTIVSAAAGFIPAARASRIDPILALRTE